MDLSAFLSSPLSSLILRPAYDRLAVPLLARVYFPVSRLWAKALAGSNDGRELVAAAPGLARHRRRLAGAVARAQERARAYDVANARWEAALFGADEVPTASLPAVEAARAAAAQDLMTARAAFLPFRRDARLTPFGWDIPTPAQVEARHGPRRDGGAAAFPAPDPLPAFEVSRVMPGDGFETLWIRADSAVAGRRDTLGARIARPIAGTRPGPCPAVVFAHGIAMETEFWRGTSSLVTGLARDGVVVVRPEGPWHGRRRLAGTFGGEPVLATSPMGLLDYFEAHVRELAMLIGWAHATLGGPVAVGGVSLGALAAQMAVSAAGHWPQAFRPDAALLVTTSGSLMDVTMTGSLTRALGLPERLVQAGWDETSLARWMPLLEPGRRPALDGGRVVAVLGSADEITPYGSGRALVSAWGVPLENLFIRPLGHFSASLNLYRDAAPLARLKAVLAEMGREQARRPER